LWAYGILGTSRTRRLKNLHVKNILITKNRKLQL
jgi:hypothetical protein